MESYHTLISAQKQKTTKTAKNNKKGKMLAISDSRYIVNSISA